MTEQEQKNIIHNINFGYRLDAVIYTLEKVSRERIGFERVSPSRYCLTMPVKLKGL